MSTINQLSAAESVRSSDQVPVYSSANGDARKASFNTIVEFLSSAFASLTVSSFVKVQSVSVQNLPSAEASGAGARAFVTDATAATFNSVVAGGGANAVPVFSDGSDWRIG